MSRFSLPTKSFALLACLVLLSTALGCNIGNVTSPDPASNGVVLNPNFVRVLPTSERDFPELQMAPTTDVVSADRGGIVSNGRVSLEFAPGALSEDATVTIDAEDPKLLVVDLAPEGVYFKAPVILSFDLLGTSAEGQAATTETVWFNEDSQKWEVIPSLPPDDPNVARAQLEHFSKYGRIEP